MKNFVFPYLLTIFFLISYSTDAYSQYQSRGKEFDYTDAERFFKSGNYYDALSLYELLSTNYPKVIEYNLKMGVCQLNLTENPEEAIKNIEDVYNKKPKTKDVTYFLGKAYALNYQFEKAIEIFEKALIDSKISTEYKEGIPLLIEQCRNGIEITKDTVNVSIINLGKPVNSAGNEYSPTISADESTLVFTYTGVNSIGGRQDEFTMSNEAGNFYEDIYISTKEGKKWGKPVSISDRINSQTHEASVSLSPDGQSLFIYKDTKANPADILISRKENGEWTSPKSLSINTASWEGSAAISPDGKLLLFSSDRKGGLGGRDIYSAVLQGDGSWGDIANLGEMINTPYDDDAPFIHSDGVTFNFCSQGHTSIGGYDIFESKIIGESVFLEPRNIGYPINTTSNDIYFVVSGKGNAYYSSAKKGGYGQKDIYVMDVSEITTTKPVLLVKGTTKVNGEYGGSKITIKTESGKALGTYHSDQSDGKYQFYVDLDDYYVITYEVDGFSQKIESIDATKFSEYTEVERNINFNSEDVKIEGVLLNTKNNTPIANLRIRLVNKARTFSLVDTTDGKGRYNFSNLPKDDYYLLFLDEEDEKILGVESYILKGKMTKNGLDYNTLTINGEPVDESGVFQMIMKDKHIYTQLGIDHTKIEEDINSEDVKIEGILLNTKNNTPITNLRIRLVNKARTFSLVDTTDGKGRYNFSNLPKDDYYLLFLDEEDEKILGIESYILKGKMTKNGLDYNTLTINGEPVDESGAFQMIMKDKHIYTQLTYDFNRFDELDWSDPSVYQALRDRYGDQSSDGLIFKVQVAAYGKPRNYESGHLEGLGKVEQIFLEDEITRFAIGSFKTLNEAEKLREKAMKKGQKDAFVIIFINGERFYLGQLLNMGIFKLD